MNLSQALKAIQENKEIIETIYKQGLSKEYALIDKAVYVLISEHGEEYVSL